MKMLFRGSRLRVNQLEGSFFGIRIKYMQQPESCRFEDERGAGFVSHGNVQHPCRAVPCGSGPFAEEPVKRQIERRIQVCGIRRAGVVRQLKGSERTIKMEKVRNGSNRVDGGHAGEGIPRAGEAVVFNGGEIPLRERIDGGKGGEAPRSLVAYPGGRDTGNPRLPVDGIYGETGTVGTPAPVRSKKLPSMYRRLLPSSPVIQ